MSRPGGEGTTGAPVSPTFSRSVRKRRCDQAQAAERLCTCFFCGQPSEESARRCRGRARSPAAVSSWGHAGLPCTARAGGVRVQIGPRRCPVLPQTLGQGHGLPSSRDRLHSISGPRLRRHFLLEAILLLSCVSHPPPTQPSWHHQDSPASAPRLRPATCICGRGRGWLRATSPHSAPPNCAPRQYRFRAGPRPPLQVGLQLCPPAGVGRAEVLGSCCSWRRKAWRLAWKDRGQPPAPRAQVQASEAKLRRGREGVGRLWPR